MHSLSHNKPLTCNPPQNTYIMCYSPNAFKQINYAILNGKYMRLSHNKNDKKQFGIRCVHTPLTMCADKAEAQIRHRCTIDHRQPITCSHIIVNRTPSHPKIKYIKQHQCALWATFIPPPHTAYHANLHR